MGDLISGLVACPGCQELLNYLAPETQCPGCGYVVSGEDVE